MKSTAEPSNSPRLPSAQMAVNFSTWKAAVELTLVQASITPTSSDEWSAFWWHAWRPASRKWRTLLHDGGSEAFRRLREVWDQTRERRADA